MEVTVPLYKPLLPGAKYIPFIEKAVLLAGGMNLFASVKRNSVRDKR